MLIYNSLIVICIIIVGKVNVNEGFFLKWDGGIIFIFRILKFIISYKKIILGIIDY